MSEEVPVAEKTALDLARERLQQRKEAWEKRRAELETQAKARLADLNQRASMAIENEELRLRVAELEAELAKARGE